MTWNHEVHSCLKIKIKKNQENQEKYWKTQKMHVWMKYGSEGFLNWIFSNWNPPMMKFKTRKIALMEKRFFKKKTWFKTCKITRKYQSNKGMVHQDGHCMSEVWGCDWDYFAKFEDDFLNSILLQRSDMPQ